MLWVLCAWCWEACLPFAMWQSKEEGGGSLQRPPTSPVSFGFEMSRNKTLVGHCGRCDSMASNWGVQGCSARASAPRPLPAPSWRWGLAGVRCSPCMRTHDTVASGTCNFSLPQCMHCHFTVLN